MESINIADRDMLFWTGSPNEFNDSNSNDFIVNEQKEKFDYDTIKEKYLRTNKEGQRELILPLKYYSVN